MIVDLFLGGLSADGFVAGFYRYYVVSHNSNYFDDNLSRFWFAVASPFAVVLFTFQASLPLCCFSCYFPCRHRSRSDIGELYSSVMVESALDLIGQCPIQ